MSIIDLGGIRVNNRHVIQLKSYDPYPATGLKTFRASADDVWYPSVQYREGDWITIYNGGGTVYYNGKWNPGTNTPTLNDTDGYPVDTIYIANRRGTVNLGNGNLEFQVGDIAQYNGTKWTRIAGSQHSYICIREHWSSSVFDSSYWQQTTLPPYYNLDPVTGVLHATLPYIPIYSNTYTFTIRIDKLDSLTSQIGYSNQQFQLTIQGTVDNALTFQTGADLGTIYRGYLSELAISASHQGPRLNVRYELSNGNFPSGLSLGNDGSIIGRVSYSEDIGVYRFTIRASDQYGQTTVREFSLSVIDYDQQQYTQIYIRPFLSRAKRYQYSSFISDTRVFPRPLLYRPADLNFGSQVNIKMYLEYGIQQAQLAEYTPAMEEYFYKKKLWFGDIKVAVAKTTQGIHLYDAVYVEIVDPLVRNPDQSNINVPTTFPNSIESMRTALQTMEISGEPALIDDLQLSLWMRTPDPETGIRLGYIPAAVLCYTIPNQGIQILKNIEDFNSNNFDFKDIDFEIDRLVVENNLTTPIPEYLIFPRLTN